LLYHMPMSTITFDTLKYVKQLESAGVPSIQAEAFVNAQRDILSEALDTSLATKSDIRDIRTDVQAVKMEVKNLEQKMDAKIDKLVWMVGILVALAAANFAKQYF
jgi:hypothetical protein